MATTMTTAAAAAKPPAPNPGSTPSTTPPATALADMERLLMDRTADLRRRNEVIRFLQDELQLKDSRIRELRNELDKLRTVVQGQLQVQLQQVHLGAGPLLRAKRQAISAEPSRDHHPVEKVDKPD